MGGRTRVASPSDSDTAGPMNASRAEHAPEVVSFPAGATVGEGDVLVFHTPTPLRQIWRFSLWLPLLIHLATRSRWNHAALAIGNSPAGHALMVEATARGVAVNRVDSRNDEMRPIRLRYDGNDRTEVLASLQAAWACGMDGSPHSSAGSAMSFREPHKIKFGNQVICSELVAESLERAGY